MSILPLLMAVMGNGRGLNVADIFSAYAYSGTGVNRSIINGVGGDLVWIKNRSDVYNHVLFDIERGANNFLETNTTAAASSATSLLAVFGSDGFGLGTGAQVNGSGDDYISWAFKKSPKFFGVVGPYTGNGVAGREVSHPLGCTPGMIVVKSLNTTRSWIVYHKNLSKTGYGGCLSLNTTNDQYLRLGAFRFGNDTAIVDPTDSVFTLGSSNETNGVGEEYIAYLFAHDPAGGGVIQCGVFSDSDANGATVDLGWEPQWILIKKISGTGNWELYDTARGITSGDDARLFPNLDSAEQLNNNIETTPTGFKYIYPDSQTWVYMAIRAAA